LGVSGGIAAYKACEIVRRLTEHGLSVQVVMTRAATQFVSPLTFATLSGRPVWTDEFPSGIGTPASSRDVIAHIDLVEQAEVFLLAPATANTIAKIAHGVADNLLTSAALAWQGPALVAPAMNHRMYENPVTQENLRKLSQLGYSELEPEEGWLACGETGRGRLASVDRVVSSVLHALRGREGKLSGRRICVTSGSTREPLDPVRFISNASTGLLALKCASAVAAEGAQIDLICGTGVSPELLAEIPAEVTKVKTAAEMKASLEDRLDGCDALLMLAAVADFAPAAATHKIKKGEHKDLKLELRRTDDILHGLRKRQDIIKIGVSLETEDVLERAREKLQDKRLDAIIAVDYSTGEVPYGEVSLRAAVLTAQGEHLPMAARDKTELAGEIAHLTAILLHNQGRRQ
jgi:phosphopantothenoylcysteine decarboxylase/phosphopantothenate--cysteine ligase